MRTIIICGISELGEHLAAGVTHVLSILGPNSPDPPELAAFAPHQRLILRFHDVIEPQPGNFAPTREDIERVLAFGREVMETPKGQLLVHCRAGVSRSTAAATLILVQANPEWPPSTALDAVAAIRPCAWPNLLILELGDTVLGRNGEIAAAVGAIYQRVLERNPEFVDQMIDAGRYREVSAARLSDRAHPKEILRNLARDSVTLDFYSASAAVYVASGAERVSRHLPAFLNLLPPQARILELGCGGGRDAAAMIAAGFDVDPTDGTPEIARKAEQRLGRRVRVMHFDELDAVDFYDAVWANASLLHVPRSFLPQILALVFRALKPGGLHFASYKGGGAEGRDRYGRYFNYVSQEEINTAYRRSGPWEVLSLTEYLGGGYDGQQGPWVAITVRRPG